MFSAQTLVPPSVALEELLLELEELEEELLDELAAAAVAPVQSSMHSSGSRQQFPFRSFSNNSGVAKG